MSTKEKREFIYCGEFYSGSELRELTGANPNADPEVLLQMGIRKIGSSFKDEFPKNITRVKVGEDYNLEEGLVTSNYKEKDIAEVRHEAAEYLKSSSSEVTRSLLKGVDPYLVILSEEFESEKARISSISSSLSRILTSLPEMGLEEIEKSLLEFRELCS